MQNPVNSAQYVEPGTKLHSFIGWTVLAIFGPLFILATLLMTWGLALIAWIIAGALYSSNIRKARARLRGSAVRVDAGQFPEIYEATRSLAERLGLRECPDIYVVEDNQQNAFAFKQGSRQCVVLVDDVVFGLMATGNVRALHFIIAHELAHHALGHTGYLRSLITKSYTPLSRLDELSCDAVAHALVGDAEAARDALTLLLIGPQLFQRIDRRALEFQAQEVLADKFTKKSEARLSHPLLLRRYARLQQMRTA
jgi:Zn-dependent protease with chaperone function